jgi:hypothetical protein
LKVAILANFHPCELNGFKVVGLFWEGLNGSNSCPINGDTVFGERLGQLVKVANPNSALW